MLRLLGFSIKGSRLANRKASLEGGDRTLTSIGSSLTIVLELFNKYDEIMFF